MLKKLTIRLKLSSGFISIAIIAIVIGLIGFIGMMKIRNAMNSIANVQLQGIEQIGRIQFLQTDIKANQYGLLSTSFDADERNLRVNNIQSQLEEMDKRIKSFDSIPKTPENLTLWKAFLTDLESWKTMSATFMTYVKERTSLMEQGVDESDSRCASLDIQQFVYYTTMAKPAFDLCEADVQKIVDMQSKDANGEKVSANIVASRNSILLIIAIIAGIVFATVIGMWISANIHKIIQSVNKQFTDVADNIMQGKLATRADIGQTDIEFRGITIGYNNTIEALVRPMRILAGYIESFSKGEIPEKSTQDYQNDYDEMKRNVNHCIDSMQGLIIANRVLQQMAVNDYTEKIEGDYPGIYSDVCNAVNLVRERINHTIDICERISEGDLSDREVLKDLGKRSEHDRLTPSVLKMSDSINDLIVDTNNLASAAIEGKLAARADVTKHNGEYASVIKGVNNTLDAVVGPLTVAADYISRISIGDMPPVITEKYNGDFNIIINNLNTLINALNEIVAKAKLVADGDLTVDLKRRSENDELMKSLTAMVRSTANIISEFQTATNNISASSQQMSSSSQQMSQGASEQASSTEEVSSSMEEMAANIQQNTENARQTEMIALNASEGITKTAEASQRTLKYMQEIADKVSIIGEIARQTNILALNAAVEAARAGEYGKGFAVVAAEVRKLAERSQVSAVEIDTLTRTSLRTTEEAGKMMAALVPEISKTGKLVQEIAAASMEQNSGAEQVNNAIQQLNQITQQNAAASEEMATSSEELAGQAQQLMEMISFFKLENKSTSKITTSSDKAARTIVSNKIVAQIPVVHKGVNINMEEKNFDSDYERF